MKRMIEKKTTTIEEEDGEGRRRKKLSMSMKIVNLYFGKK